MPIGPRTQAVVDALNEVVMAEGGRIYLAKDALHARRALPRHGGARLQAFAAVRRKWDPQRRLSSAQSVRLLGDAAVKVALLGATKGMGRALARLLAERGDPLCLLGRDRDDLARSAADWRCAARPATVGTAAATCSIRPASPRRSTPRSQALGGLDTVVVTAGLFATQEALERDAELRARLLAADFTNTVLFCELARERLLAARRRHAVRLQLGGRRSRPQAGAFSTAPPRPGCRTTSTASITSSAPHGLRTILVKPGFVKTGMTAGLPPPPFAGEPDAVARASCAPSTAARRWSTPPASGAWSCWSSACCRAPSCGASASEPAWPPAVRTSPRPIAAAPGSR